jgi:hypothetical protein
VRKGGEDMQIYRDISIIHMDIGEGCHTILDTMEVTTIGSTVILIINMGGNKDILIHTMGGKDNNINFGIRDVETIILLSPYYFK